MTMPSRNRPIIHTLAIPFLAASAGSLAAMDGSYLDLRVGYTFADASYDGMFDGTSGDEFENDWDDNHRGFVQLIGSPNMREGAGGWLFGVSLTVNARDTDSDSSDADIEYRSYVGTLYLGYGVPLGRIFQLELVPFFGAGISEAKREDLVNDEDSDEHTVLEYGATLNGVFTFEHFQIGAMLGYLLSDSSAEFRDAVDPNENVDYDFQSGDFTYSGFLGWRF
jgi:hypothetical protein